MNMPHFLLFRDYVQAECINLKFKSEQKCCREEILYLRGKSRGPIGRNFLCKSYKTQRLCAHTSLQASASFPKVSKVTYVRFNSCVTIVRLIRRINHLALIHTNTHTLARTPIHTRANEVSDCSESMFVAFSLLLFPPSLYYTELRREETSSLTFSSIRCFSIPGEGASFPAARRSCLRHDDTGQQCGGIDHSTPGVHQIPTVTQCDNDFFSSVGPSAFLSYSTRR